jgi:hypothetical protein
MAVTGVYGLRLSISAVHCVGHVRDADLPESRRALSRVLTACRKALTALSLASEAIFEKMADISLRKTSQLTSVAKGERLQLRR